MAKDWYKSRTLWTAIVGLAAEIYLVATGEILPAAVGGAALTIIFFALRINTTEAIKL